MATFEHRGNYYDEEAIKVQKVVRNYWGQEPRKKYEGIQEILMDHDLA